MSPPLLLLPSPIVITTLFCHETTLFCHHTETTLFWCLHPVLMSPPWFDVTPVLLTPSPMVCHHPVMSVATLFWCHHPVYVACHHPVMSPVVTLMSPPCYVTTLFWCHHPVSVFVMSPPCFDVTTTCYVTTLLCHHPVMLPVLLLVYTEWNQEIFYRLTLVNYRHLSYLAT